MNLKSKNIRHTLYIFIVFEILTALFLYILFTDKINYFKKNRDRVRVAQFELINRNNSQIAKVVFDTLINREEVLKLIKLANSKESRERAREKLYRLLKRDYENIKKYQIRQLHFHLPNRESLLRMHRPSKYGDNLKDVRYSIEYVNESVSYIEGFEEGRVYNGFRYVFPLKYRDRHIGSVEVGLSSNAFVSIMKESFNSEPCFIIKKSIVDNKVWSEYRDFYQESLVSQEYLYEKDKECYRDKPEYVKKLNRELKPLIKDRLKSEKVFTIYLNHNFENYLISFVPISNIQNRNVAYIIVYERSEDIDKLIYSYLLIGLFLTFTNLIISTLFALFIDRRDRLYLANRSLINLNENLEHLVEDKTRELTELNSSLEYKVNIATKRLLTQSRYTAMADIVSMLAHQWRQPLNLLSLRVYDIAYAYENGTLNDEYIQRYERDAQESLDNLSKLIDNFSKYFKPDREKILISPKELILRAIDIIEPILESESIELNISCLKSCEFKVDIYPNELIQVIVNICKNSIDSFRKREIRDRVISIDGEVINMNFHLTIKDSAGGVESDFIDKIFEPYFSTKGKQFYGVGLFMSKELIEKHMQGSIQAKNIENGLEVKIVIPIFDKKEFKSGA